MEKAAEPQIYHPDMAFGGGYIAVRSTLPPNPLAASIRSVLHSIDPSLAVGDIQTMADRESEATAQRRFQTSLLTVFAAIALFLALVGLYGLMAYSVSRRTREVGIRMALGAQRVDVLMLVLKKAALLLGIGLITGLAASWFSTRVLRSFSLASPSTIPSPSLRLRPACGLRPHRRTHPRAPRRLHRSHASPAHRVASRLSSGSADMKNFIPPGREDTKIAPDKVLSEIFAHRVASRLSSRQC